MKFLRLILLTAAAAHAANLTDWTRCGTVSPSEDELNDSKGAISNATADAPAELVINTYVHIVETLANQYTYSQTQIFDQMTVLNQTYAPIGIAFRLRSIDRTINNAWARSGPYSTAASQMKTSLHRGTYQELNLYFLSDIGADGDESILGQCTFPITLPTAQDIALDGCINGAMTLPGGGGEPYDLGYTAVHEVGHWFYLLHVFQGFSCSGPGDEVYDTPIQSTATSGCPAYKDSCPYEPGPDNIHNFMDYSIDSCLDLFTSGQGVRARAAYSIYRKGVQ